MHVFFDERAKLGLVQRRRRVKHGVIDDIPHLFGNAVYARDRHPGKDQFHREAPQGDNDLGLDQGDLLVNIGPARGKLIGLWLAVVGGATLDDVADVHLAPREVDGRQQLFQELPCRADKGTALLVFMKAGGFADEHDLGILRSLPGNS